MGVCAPLMSPTRATSAGSICESSIASLNVMAQATGPSATISFSAIDVPSTFGAGEVEVEARREGRQRGVLSVADRVVQKRYCVGAFGEKLGRQVPNDRSAVGDGVDALSRVAHPTGGRPAAT